MFLLERESEIIDCQRKKLGRFILDDKPGLSAGCSIPQ
jgi:hypothetical protein